MIDQKTLKAAAKEYADMAVKQLLADGPRPAQWSELKILIEETFVAAFEKAEAIKKDPSAVTPPICSTLAKVQINFVRREGPDHAFACGEHAGALLEKVLEVSVNGAARVSKLPMSSDDQCELGVE